MTPQTVITLARYILNDTTATYRNSDVEMLLYVNLGMLETSILRPDLFQNIGDLTCTASEVEQLVAFSSAQRVIKVIGVHDGAAATRFDMDSMDRFNPGWRSDTAGAMVQWSSLPSDPLKVFIYPQSPTTQVIDVLYVKNPTSLAISDSITQVPVTFESALVDYVVYRAESKDDEHANSGRAVAHYTSFAEKVKGS